MRQEQTRQPSTSSKTRLRIEPSGKVITFRTIFAITVVRAIRYPLATLAGTGSALVAHAAIITWVPANAGLLLTSAFGLFAGIALFLVLTSLMVLDENRLNHVGRLAQTGAIVSVLATTVVAVPILAGLTLMPVDWQSAPQWQFLKGWWPTASIGFCVVALGCVFPAFLIAWPTSAHTGLPLLKSILFVWRGVEDSSYASAKMSIFIGLVGWVLVTLPGTGLLAPVFFAHLSAALSKRLVLVGEQ